MKTAAQLRQLQEVEKQKILEANNAIDEVLLKQIDEHLVDVAKENPRLEQCRFQLTGYNKTLNQSRWTNLITKIRAFGYKITYGTWRNDDG